MEGALLCDVSRFDPSRGHPLPIHVSRRVTRHITKLIGLGSQNGNTMHVDLQSSPELAPLFVVLLFWEAKHVFVCLGPISSLAAGTYTKDILKCIYSIQS